MPHQQLPLDLSLAPALGREDFVTSGCNEAALAALDSWPDWQVPNLLLLGPTGSGKTHLAHIFQKRTDAFWIDAGLPPDQLAEFASRHSALVLENADRFTMSEADFFHLLNATKEAGSSLLLTARQWPAAWNIKTPDLMSRLKAMPVVELHEPDDQLLNAVFVKLFADRQLIPDPTVVSYLTRRMERSISAAVDLVEALDREAMATKRAVTRHMAAQIIERCCNSETDQ